MLAARKLDLKVPPEAAYASLVEYFVTDAAERAAIHTNDSQRLTHAARLAFELIVGLATIEEPEPVLVSAKATPESFVVSITERGLPIDDAYATNDSRWHGIVEAVDEAHWHARGTAGSELHLVVRRPLQTQDLGTAPPIAGVPLAPEQQYVVRRFVPGDAIGVARAFFLTYGYNYPFATVYEPQRLSALNEQGSFVSVVAVSDGGEVCGHAALRRKGEAPTADFCSAIVLPAHRGRHLLERLVDETEREAVRIGLASYYSEPVTDHPRTQAVLERMGATPCGVTLGAYPRNFLPKHMELSTTTQRQSVMLYAKVVTQREAVTAYLPERHGAIAADIYERLNLRVLVADGGRPTGRGSLRVAVDNGTHVGEIAVARTGADTLEQIRQATADLRSMRRLGAIYVSLPLEDSGTPWLCDALETVGFFFSGIGPWMLEGRDSLRLQLPLTPIDATVLTVVNDFGRRLLDYVDSERRRISDEKKRGEA